MGLKPLQKANVEQERKISIVATFADTKEMSKDDAVALYNEVIEDLVINYKGELIDTAAAKVEVLKEYKKPAEERLYPVYKAKSKSDPSKIEFYIIPTYGFGLWNNISGYVALEPDLNTIKGVRFDHIGETPGLGARITDDENVYNRYIGKKLFDEEGKLQSVEMQKGEGNNYDDQPHKVDGMSGATLTAKGVNNMLLEYFGAYQAYFNSVKKSNSQTTLK